MPPRSRGRTPSVPSHPRALSKQGVRGRAALLVGMTLGLTVSAAGCADLSPLRTGECGNIVVDATEDCDGHTPDGGICAPPGSPHACRYVCEADTGCPAGYGCGFDGVCRRAPEEERLIPMGNPVPFPSLQSVAAADFDGNGAAEIVVFEDEDALGRRTARVVAPHFEGEPTIVPIAVTMTAAAIDRLAGDATDDITFADVGGVLLLHGTPDLRGELGAYPSMVPTEGTLLRAVPVDVLPSQPGDELVALVQHPPEPSISLLRAAGLPGQAELATLPGDMDQLAGDVVRARFDDSLPCPALVLAFHGADRARVFQTCRTSDKGFSWNDSGVVDDVLLPPGETIGTGLLAADLDLDAHLDILVAAESGALFVAWGQGDGTFLSAKAGGTPGEAGPFTLPLAAGKSPGLPLAVADLDADGVLDFVFPTGVLVSKSGSHTLAFDNLGAPWTVAVAADLNADGRLDITAAAADSLNIDFLNNAGVGVFNAFVLPTEGGVDLLATGDFDGDLVDDLAISETASDASDPQSHIEVAFGSPFGPPGAPVEMASLDHASAMYAAHLPPPSAAYGLAGADHVADLVVTSRSVETMTDRTFELRGGGARVLTAPLSLTSPGGAARPLALSTGLFGDPVTDIVALAADVQEGNLHLFRVESIYEVELHQTLASQALPGGLHPLSKGPVAALHYGALLAAGDLDRNGDAEAVVVAPAGDAPDGAAVVISDYDRGTFQFVPRPPQPLALRLGVDSRLTLRDVDGDGRLDALLVGGSSEEPTALVILWNDGKGGLDTASPVHLLLDDGVTGAACLPTRAGKGCVLFLTTSTHTYRVAPGAYRELNAEVVPDLPGGVDITAGDFDADGVTDVAIGQPNACAIYLRAPEIR